MRAVREWTARIRLCSWSMYVLKIYEKFIIFFADVHGKKGECGVH